MKATKQLDAMPPIEATLDRTQFRKNLSRFRRVGAAAWRPKETLPSSDWCERHFHLSRDWEASGGLYDLTRRPYWRDVLNLFDDPEVFRITVQKATQVGGTLTLIGAILAAAKTSPAPAMVCLPNRDAAIEFRDRVYANMRESPELRRYVPPEGRWNTRHIDLGTYRVYLAWSGSRQRLRGRACARVYLTEKDVYQTGSTDGGDPNKAAGERVKSFWRWKIYGESSPEGDPSTIGDDYAASDQRRWYVECPHCGKWQELRFFPYKAGKRAGRGGVGGLKDEAGNWRDPEDARNQAHYICVAGCQIDNADKQDMVEGGQWVPKGQWVDRNGRLAGKPDRPPRHAGVHLWSIHSEKISFGDLAAAYLEHRRDGKIAEFWNNWLGLAYTPRAKMPHWKKLGSRLAGTHLRGQVPSDVWFLTAGLDVQEDRVYWVIRGWGDQVTSWLIDWGQLIRYGDEVEEDDDGTIRLKSDLLQIPETVLDRRFPIVGGKENPLGRTSLRVRLAGIDANYRTMDVHEWLRSLDDTTRKRIRAIRGDHKVDPREKYRMNEIERNTRTGEIYKGKLELWGIFVNVFKQDLADRFLAPANEPGAFLVTSDARVAGTDYLRQLVNEPKTIETDRHGRRKVVWKERSHQIGHDFWDCEVYARALAEMIVGDRTWDASRWPRPQRNQEGRRASRRPGQDLSVR